MCHQTAACGSIRGVVSRQSGIPMGQEITRLAPQEPVPVPTGPKQISDDRDFNSPSRDLSFLVDDNKDDDWSFNPSPATDSQEHPSRARFNTSLPAECVDDAEAAWTDEDIRTMIRLHAQGLMHVEIAVSTRTMRFLCFSLANSTGPGLIHSAVGYTRTPPKLGGEQVWLHH